MEKLCTKCKISFDETVFYLKKDGHRRSWCAYCMQKYANDYRANHPHTKEEIKIANHNCYIKQKVQRSEKYKIWRQNNKEKKAEMDREYYKNHSDIIKNRAHKFYEDNKERILVDCKIYRKNNLEHIKQVKKEYNKSHVREKRIRENYRRCAKHNNGGSYTVQEWVDLCNKYENKCLACGKTGVQLTADHIVPVSGGGSNYIYNIQPLCRSCNCSKSTKTIDYRNQSSLTRYNAPDS
jgi:hypothetical protein